MSFKVLLASVILVVLVVVASGEDTREIIYFSPEVTEKLKDIVPRCLAEYGVSEDALDIVRAGQFREDKPFQNFVFCSYKKFGVLDENDHLLPKLAAESFPEELGMLAVIENCNKKEVKDPVNKLFEYFKCFQKTSPVRMQLY